MTTELIQSNFTLPVADNQIIHLLIVGETGSGKSTMARKIVAMRQEHSQIVILDPHAIQHTSKHDGDWGMHVTGAGRNYKDITDFMYYLVNVLQSRYAERSEGKEDFEDISIFIDEWPAIKSHCNNAAEFMKVIAREGRKVNMRLVILTQSALVESLGLKGEGDTRENFSFIFLGSKARKFLPVPHKTEKYPAVLSWQDQIMHITVKQPAWNISASVKDMRYKLADFDPNIEDYINQLQEAKNAGEYKSKAIPKITGVAANGSRKYLEWCQIWDSLKLEPKPLYDVEVNRLLKKELAIEDVKKFSFNKYRWEDDFEIKRINFEPALKEAKSLGVSKRRALIKIVGASPNGSPKWKAWCDLWEQL